MIRKSLIGFAGVGAGKARGIYLREPADTGSTSQPKAATLRTKLRVWRGGIGPNWESRGNPRLRHAKYPPSRGRTRVTPNRRNCIAVIALLASLGQVQ